MTIRPLQTRATTRCRPTRSPLIKARGGGGGGSGGDGAIFDSADWRGEAVSEALQSQRSAEAPTNFLVTTGISLY